MHRGPPESRDGIEMLGRRIPFVTVKSVSRVTGVQLQHLAVTSDFGDNRRGRDGRAPPISPDDPTLREKQVGNPETVDQDEIG